MQSPLAGWEDERLLDANGAIADFPAGDNNSASFKFKTKTADRTGNDGIKDVKIMVALEYLTNFWRTLEISLINRLTNLILTWSANCFIIDAPVNNQVPICNLWCKTFVPVVSFSFQDNTKPLHQLKWDFERTINWNKYQSKVTVQERKWYSDYLIDTSFQGVNMIFVLSFENNIGQTSCKRYYLPQVEISVYNVMIDVRNFFDQPVKNNLIIYDNIWKITTGQGDNYATGCLLDYTYFKNYYKMIAIDLSDQQELDADWKAIQQIHFTRNLDWPGNTTMFFIIAEAK